MEKTAYFSFGNKKICFNFINPSALGPESIVLRTGLLYP